MDDFYKNDLNENENLSQETFPEWNVYFNGSFWSHESGRERPGREIFIGKHFVWGNHEWTIPAIYSCGKGLVVEFCMKILPSEVYAFAKKWDLTPENEFVRELTKEEEMLMERENPLDFSFHGNVRVNGKQLDDCHSYGIVYNPCVFEGFACEGDNEVAKRILAHYGLDDSFGWMIRRACYPWKTKRRPEINSLSITMEQERVEIPGPRFSLGRVGDSFSFVHPIKGTKHTLMMQEYEQEEMPTQHFLDRGLEYPTHYRKMAYTITPEISNRDFTICDCADSDAPRKKRRGRYSQDGKAAAIAIIGGADGPTAIFFCGHSGQGHLRTVCSSLHFEKVDCVEWRMVFYEKEFENKEVL